MFHVINLDLLTSRTPGQGPNAGQLRSTTFQVTYGLACNDRTMSSVYSGLDEISFTD